MNQHERAVIHLSAAAKHARGWHALELAIRRMLIECYERHVPLPGEAPESSRTLASMILDSYFNAQMSSSDLRLALSQFASVSGSDSNTLKWYHSATAEDETSLPFGFAVMFPGRTHAIAGDTVKVSVFLKSNLDYAVHVNAIVLLSLAGDLPIQSDDLMRAKNASEGSGGGIIIQANTAIVLTTEVELPRDLSNISYDDGPGTEVTATSGKGSFSVRARPRTSGLTSAGGARLVSEESVAKGNQNAQGWSTQFLGGKPLRCDGLRMLFYPVQAERVSDAGESVTVIEVTIEKKKAKTAANIKRTPFEEDNYVSSAWSRSSHLPLSQGPRCLRVLNPQPELSVSNLTDVVTGGKSLEGTVNRVVLRLQPGHNETCRNIQVSISLFSVLISQSGVTMRLVHPEQLTDDSEVDGSVDMSDPSLRTPVLVASDPSGHLSAATGLGYLVPDGWGVAGSGHQHSFTYEAELKSGDASFLELNFFRPAVDLGVSAFVDSTCKTDYYVTVSYQQERVDPSKQKRSIRRSLRRRGRAKTSDAEENQNEDEPRDDDVSVEYAGALVWVKPFTAIFKQGTRTCFPSGSTHPANLVGLSSTFGLSEECAVIDGERVTVKCTISEASHSLQTEIAAVQFMGNSNDDEPVTINLLTGLDGSDLLYQTETTDPSPALRESSKLILSYGVSVKMKDRSRKGGVSSTLGSLSAQWRPVGKLLEVGSERTIEHGPLPLGTPSAIFFAGLSCYVEHAPFHVRVVSYPEGIRALVPFEVQFEVTNTTVVHQIASVYLEEPLGTSENSHDRVVAIGVVDSDLALGPSETKALTYMLIASQPGLYAFPSLRISSQRYNSWVLNDVVDRHLYVFP
jgi:hypothetical protein